MSKLTAVPLDFPVSWEEMHRNSRALARQLQQMGTGWRGIIGVARGGLVPATIVSRDMDIRLVETLCISSYDYNKQGKAKALKIPEIAGDGKGWIVIDDLVDTGNTFRAARKLLPKAYFAAIYAKPKGLNTVDAFITTVSQNTWIHFPWEWITPQWNLDAQIVAAAPSRKSGRKKA